MNLVERYLLNKTVKVKIIPVPDRSRHLPLDPPQEQGSSARFVSESVLYLEPNLVEMFENGELADQLQ